MNNCGFPKSAAKNPRSGPPLPEEKENAQNFQQFCTFFFTKKLSFVIILWLMKFGEWRIDMALIEYDEYKQKLRDLGPELDKLSAALDIESARQEVERREAETAQDGFWNDLERSQKVQMRLKQLQNKILRQEKLIGEWEDLTALC